MVLPDGFGSSGSLTLIQPASVAASAETATAAAVARERTRPDGGRDEGTGAGDDDGDGVGVRDDWRCGLGRTAGPPDPERRDGGTDALPNSRSPPEDTHHTRPIAPGARSGGRPHSRRHLGAAPRSRPFRRP
ncbi:hypothetical protein Sliba_42020 [Streptomyces nigrescens]|uniref:Uncharacterized protein n=1 Tax=Streptomyces nigrescens TaxID=1920 RepID=A0A640TJJ4_STRNI|nr:hypothetical protein Sliba_42020 [Streptomyces libani subsp. libani]GGV93904.1 hypothetical protein GCM10010500_30700 [Streptomyces libani subsp. libani]